MTHNHTKQRRERFRIVYPTPARPALTIKGRRYEVLDISETGVRFVVPEDATVELGQSMRATITFQDNTSLDVEGETLRIVENEIVLHLSRNIAYSRIVKEQLDLIRRYNRYR